ncbi:PREDICTED: cysteine and histidine-rich domain-containing protein RAR1 [Tarenaya hassleriana]|uniref:cysteine and histidine-rich domain-containing protein RAR1 n=1 Tax=Tarenaya hassleriana TaxID=28532 RepID=UPI00053C1801|nr:PREDICTED: cysteine and histidine-rich domain-containing protein RAR1 [Tarenaya hassleriana]
MEEKSATSLRCQRIGCNAMFTDDDNPEGSCQFHDSGPIFHDGMKEWSCCKKRSHDFSLFLEIPGCKTGKHTTEKPVIAKPAPKQPVAIPHSSPGVNSTTKESCSRCRQGFFCSDHGSQTGPKPQKAAMTPREEENAEPELAVKKKVGMNEPQVCKNKGCGKTFKEIENHETACSYHPGPAIFHDRSRGWKCCEVYVKEFEEFMEIPPCSKGWHNADPIA